MFTRLTRLPAKRRNREFSPSLSWSGKDVRLEPRFLAAPAFWRRYGAFIPGEWFPGSFLDDWAMANVSGLVSDPADNPFDYAESVAMAHGKSTVKVGANSSTLIGTAMAAVDDLSQTKSPNAPIGTYTVAHNLALQLGVTSTGTNPTMNSMSVGGQTQRTYDLADDSSVPEPTTLEEYVHIEFYPNGINLYAATAGAGSYAAEPGTLESLRAGLLGDATGITQAYIMGTSVSVPSSGVFVAGDTTVSYSVSTNSIIAFGSTPLGTLPTANWMGPGSGIVAGGYTLNVGTWGSLSRFGLITENAAASITAHYDAHLS